MQPILPRDHKICTIQRWKTMLLNQTYLKVGKLVRKEILMNVEKLVLL